MTTGEKIRNIREDHDILQQELADATGINVSVLNRIEKGRRPVRDDELLAIAKCLNVSTDTLLGNVVVGNGESKGVQIPVLGRVIAGIPIDAIQEVIGYEEIPKEMAATGEFFALKVKGRSMEPRILEGDVVIVRKQEDVESGDIAIVLINGNDATVKRVKKQKDGITLIANNISVYEPHYYSNDEITQLPVRILGKVVELRGKL